MRESNEIKSIRKDLQSIRDKIDARTKAKQKIPESWRELEIQIHLTLVEALEPNTRTIRKVVYGKGSPELPIPRKKGRKPKRSSKL